MISAVSNVSMSAYTAAYDYVHCSFEPGAIHPIGIETEGAIAVALADYVPGDVKEQVGAIERDLAEGKITINLEYTGAEFNP